MINKLKKLKKNFKKIAKYTLNALTIINALIINIAPIWNISADKITKTIAEIIAVISMYLLGNKGFNYIKENK